MFELTKRFTFDAAHFLPMVSAGHKCRRLHGHTYTLEVSVAGDLDADAGWVLDFGDISAAVAPILKQLDHHLLNDIAGLENPTAEMLAKWIASRLTTLPLSSVTIRETPTSACVYRL